MMFELKEIIVNKQFNYNQPVDVLKHLIPNILTAVFITRNAQLNIDSTNNAKKHIKTRSSTVHFSIMNNPNTLMVKCLNYRGVPEVHFCYRE